MTIGIFARVRLAVVAPELDSTMFKVGMVGVITEIGKITRSTQQAGAWVHFDGLEHKPYLFFDELEELP